MTGSRATPRAVTVDTATGRVEGLETDGILAFLGLPYAAPVIPGRRFAPPGEVAPWTGVRLAHTPGPVCPQVATYGPVGTGATSALAAGEEFLTVNVRTPSLGGRAPVLVWIHGGGYAVGSANEAVLQTGAFAARGVVEVTVNYRLGAMGFLQRDADRIAGRPSNRGLLDQIKALEWVRDNIACFGGDPDRVTLAGRSAGGFSVATLMAMPAARGLFAKALVQSGAAPATLAPEDAQRVTARFLRRLGVGEDALEHVPMAHLLTAQRDICNESYTLHDWARDGLVALVGTPFQPVLDASLPQDPEIAAAAGRTHAVPMMTGCTSAEYLTHATAHAGMTRADAIRLLDPRVRSFGLDGATIVARYEAALPHHSPIGLWRAIGGDLVFQNPTTRFARLHGARQPVHKYLYGPVTPDETGAAHGAEVGAIWHRAGAAAPDRHRVPDPALAKLVQDTWLSFVRDPVPVLPDGTEWPRFDARDARLAWCDGRSCRVASDPFAARTALWTPPAPAPGVPTE